MNWLAFQLGCVAVLAFAYAWLFRGLAGPVERRVALAWVAMILVSSWAAEDTSIRRYGMYAYPDSWWPILDRVPLLVVAIWPLVVLTARAVVGDLFPDLAPLRRSLAVAALVLVDASLVETVAVAAGLWSWAEGGYLGVPLIGMVGWAAYAFAISWPLERVAAALRGPRAWALALAVPLAALALTHAGLVAAWWGFFRHALRQELPAGAAWGALAVATVATFGLRRRGRRISAGVAIPRIAATSIFLALLVLHVRRPENVVHFSAVAVAYLGLLDWRGLARALRPGPTGSVEQELARP